VLDQCPRGGEPARVAGQDRGGGLRPDPRDRGQQVLLQTERDHHCLDLCVQPGDHLIEVVDVFQVQSAHQRVMVAEPAFQRQRQIADLGTHPAARQARLSGP
jgi:hypothetical protein